MAKHIDTLIPDINKVLEGKGSEITMEAFEVAAVDASVAIAKSLVRSTERDSERVPTPRWGQLWGSEVGMLCGRKLYYKVSGTKPDPATTASPSGRFMLGDLVEGAVLFLAKAAGHEVTGNNERVTTNFGDWSITGKRDAVIDGVSVDVKSASPYKFMEYARYGLRPEKDTFGYRSQCEFYRHYGTETTGNGSALLFVDKSSLTLKLEGVRMDKLLLDGQIEGRIHELELAHKDPELLPDRVYGDPVALLAKGALRPGENVMHDSCGICEFRSTCTAGAKLEEVKDGRKTVTVYRRPPTGGY